MGKTYLLSVFAFFLLASCGGGASSDEGSATTEDTTVIAEEVDPMKSLGIGSIEKVTLGEEIDAEMAAAGQALYEQMCTDCHIAAKNFVGPAPKGILSRRTPEWVMNMILNPEEMVMKDSIAKKLFIEYYEVTMANQNLTEEQARQVLEYFRTL
jgi:mono/diheme cytochrome c family protein